MPFNTLFFYHYLLLEAGGRCPPAQGNITPFSINTCFIIPFGSTVSWEGRRSHQTKRARPPSFRPPRSTLDRRTPVRTISPVGSVPRIARVRPLLFDMSSREYCSLGESVGHCWKDGRNYDG